MFDQVSDDALLTAAERLAAAARSTTAALVAHLAEIDARKLDLKLGYDSLYAYCRQRLKLSEYGAYHRIEAARVSRDFPEVLAKLESGELTLATVRILGPHLTTENAPAILSEASGRTKTQAEEIAVRCGPGRRCPR